MYNDEYLVTTPEFFSDYETGSAILICTIDLLLQSLSLNLLSNINLLIIEEAISKIHQIVTERKGQAGLNEQLLEELRLVGASIGFSAEYRYWVLLCGLFNIGPGGDASARNILKCWKDHEKAFLELVQ